MKHYNKFLVSENDRFVPANFPGVDDEITRIRETTGGLPGSFKTDMIISFLKNRSLQNDWIQANPSMTELITSGSLFTGGIESLFDSSRSNTGFQKELEAYLWQKLVSD
jgi:hypothetical protein